MNKRHSLNIGGIAFLIIAFYAICYMLKEGVFLPISIDSMWASIQHWFKHFHVIAVGMLPICVALVVFGAATFGSYIGTVLQRLITRPRPHHHTKRRIQRLL